MFKDCGCGCNGRKQQEKFMASLMSAFLFFVIANPETFMLVRRVFGDWVASATGYPTLLGLVLHAFVFMMIVWGMMNLKRERAEGQNPPPASVPEGEAKKDGVLPPESSMGQPMAEPMPEPVLPPSGPEPAVNTGNMSRMSNMLGGLDINAEPDMTTPAPLYGGAWRQCSCGDGTQVMILK